MRQRFKWIKKVEDNPKVYLWLTLCFSCSVSKYTCESQSICVNIVSGYCLLKPEHGTSNSLFLFRYLVSYATLTFYEFIYLVKFLLYIFYQVKCDNLFSDLVLISENIAFAWQYYRIVCWVYVRSFFNIIRWLKRSFDYIFNLKFDTWIWYCNCENHHVIRSNWKSLQYLNPFIYSILSLYTPYSVEKHMVSDRVW